MREQQGKRRQRPKNHFDPAPIPALEVTVPSGLMMPEDDVTNLKRQLVDQEAMVEVLQEDHDRLLLHNARLQNMLEEMRIKIRILHAQKKKDQHQSQQKEGQTNSNSWPEVDKELSSSQDIVSPSTNSSVAPLEAIQLGLTHHQNDTLSITSSSYLDIPPFGQFNRKKEDDETRSCDSSWNSIKPHQQKTTDKAPAPVG